MRTTINLDDDVVAFLNEAIVQSGTSLAEAVNQYLRIGMEHSKCGRKPYAVKPKPLGLPPCMSYDCIAQLLEDLEGPYHR